MLHAPIGAAYEAAVARSPGSVIRTAGALQTSVRDESLLVATWVDPELAALSVGGTLIFAVDTPTADALWAPVLIYGDEHSQRLGSNSSLLVSGPYLVRNATLVDTTLELYGDADREAFVTVAAPTRAIETVRWNGETVQFAWLDDEAVSPFALADAPLIFRVDGPPSEVSLPALLNWTYADGLPEREPGFDDSAWTIANRTETTSPYKPYAGDSVLYACDYDLCVPLTVEGLTSQLRRSHSLAWSHRRQQLGHLALAQPDRRTWCVGGPSTQLSLQASRRQSGSTVSCSAR